MTFETFLPMLQDVSSKPIRDTVDDFVEVNIMMRGSIMLDLFFVFTRVSSILARREMVSFLPSNSDISSPGLVRR